MDGVIVQALVERWRPETHTFHMHFGEVTITLQDVSVLLGLRCDGVAGRTGFDKNSLPPRIRTLLGVHPQIPITDAFKKGDIKFSWLITNYGEVPAGAPDEIIPFYARAYILLLLGKRLFPGKSSSKVHAKWLALMENLEDMEKLSWGSAVLAAMYRALCRASHKKTKQICGPLVLLHTWFFTRFPQFAPRPSTPGALPFARRYSLFFLYKCLKL
jgi:hypothetical protein